MAFTGFLRSLPFNLHLFPVFLFHKVQFGIEDLLFQGETSPHFDFNLHLFSSNLLFGLGRSICYSRRVINSSSMHAILFEYSSKFLWENLLGSFWILPFEKNGIPGVFIHFAWIERIYHVFVLTFVSHLYFYYQWFFQFDLIQNIQRSFRFVIHDFRIGHLLIILFYDHFIGPSNETNFKDIKSSSVWREIFSIEESKIKCHQKSKDCHYKMKFEFPLKKLYERVALTQLDSVESLIPKTILAKLGCFGSFSDE